MKTKFSGILTLLLAFAVQLTFAQQKNISGTVTDNNGMPLPGVNIIISGTSTGTQSDFDGNYSINANVGQTLVFTYVGFTSSEVPITPTTTTVNIRLEAGEELDAVIVTALGITRTERSLGYAVSTVRAEDLNEVRASDAIGALQGKTTGVQITPQSGNLGSSKRVLIRGISSLQGNVEPLWVVDGVPISNANIATGDRITGGFDFGNRASDINPDDIESISVLKGASAAALYGSRAAGGVIVVTTKKGKAGRAASFEVSTTYRVDTPLLLPDFQNEFINGDQGEFVADPTVPINETGGLGFPGWGPNISETSGATYVDYNGNTRPYVMQPNNVRDFYRQGQTQVTSFAASGASEDGDSDYRLGLSYTDQTGIVPNQDLNRLNLSANAGSSFSEQLRSRVNVNYVRTNIVGTAAAGANDPNVFTNIVNGLPRFADISNFADYQDEFGNQINTVGTQTNNPYWIANKNAPEVEVERFYGNAQLEFEPIQKLVFLGRAGYDSYVDKRFRKNAIGTLGRFDGNFTDDYITSREFTLDLMASYQWNVSEDFEIAPRIGTQWNERVVNRLTNVASGLTVPDLYAPGNAEVNNVSKAFSIRRIMGAFGDITFSYKNWAFINATGRNDWSSTLPEKNNSFFYPSVSGSLVFTDAFDIRTNFFNFGKIRGTWANVGNDTGYALLDFTYNPLSSFFGQFGVGGTYPFNGNLAFGSNALLADENLKPENQENFEVGLELGFFNNRLTFDATYYKNRTTDQIIQLPVPQTSGFSLFLTNIGEISNTGYELQVGAKVLRSDNFSWDLNYNFTTNKFIVEDLGDIPALNLATGFNGIAVRAVEGESLQLFGPRFRRALDEDGNAIEDQILVNAEGLRLPGEADNLGNIFPDYLMGLTSIMRYKGFALTTTFDYRKGGKIFSNTVGQLRRDGLAAETAVNGRVEIIDEGTFFQDPDTGELTPNTTPVSPQDYWNSYASASVIEGNVFDGTFLMWRELSLAYTFPRESLDRTFIKGLKVGIQARNLALFSKELPHVSPEASLGGSGSSLQGIERGGVPDTRSIGFNVNMNF